MARIKTVSADNTHGIRKLLVRMSKRKYGILAGIFQVLLPDLKVTFPSAFLYQHLHLGGPSPITRL